MHIKKRWIDGLVNEAAEMNFKMPFERGAARQAVRAQLLGEDQVEMSAQAA